MTDYKTREDKKLGAYLQRIEKIKATLKRKSYHHYLLLKEENIFYLTGFYGKDSNSILLVSLKKTYLLVNFIYYEEAKKNITNPNIEVVLYKSNRFKKLVEIVKNFNSKSISIEGTEIDHISYAKLENMLKKAGNKLTYKHGLVEDLRIIKEDSEIKNIKKA